MLVLYVSSGYLCIGYDSSGGYLFFLKFFVESNRGELSKTENKLLSGASPIIPITWAKSRHLITIGLFQNGRTGGVLAWWGVLSSVSCLSDDLPLTRR